MLTLFVFAPHIAASSGPRGFLFTQEILHAYRLNDPQQNADLERLARRLTYLRNRYPGRVRVQWVEPWSPGGLWMAWRFRVRAFPTVVIGAEYILTGEALDNLEDIVAEKLSAVSISKTQENTMTEEEKRSLFQKVKASVSDFIYGMASHEATRQALKTRGSMEHLFILITMGDLLGVPILPPYYSLRLLPYVVPQISTWKRRMLREKDLVDALA